MDKKHRVRNLQLMLSIWRCSFLLPTRE